ncbi:MULTISPECIES: hypothetical protein [unclassified Mycobacterium]|uniref:hypothetical protein n=1 Tax=unclassified Mycobacterium TaxID=2642494 RepID=UPI000B02C023|nr:MULTISPECIES: hypothetical protein [unclassified Mycobacterium]
MAIADFPVRRLILAGGVAAAIAITPMVAAFSGPDPLTTAACPSGEHVDAFTSACVPFLTPSVGGPNGGQQLPQCTGVSGSAGCVEQDILDTPGFESGGATGTTVP